MGRLSEYDGVGPGCRGVGCPDTGLVSCWNMVYMKLPLALSQQLDTLYRPFSNLLVRASIEALETHYDLVN